MSRRIGKIPVEFDQWMHGRSKKFSGAGAAKVAMRDDAPFRQRQRARKATPESIADSGRV
jgi:hypothetical protein